MDLGQVLFEERKRHGLSMSRLSEQSGVSKTSIVLIEHGKHSPTWNTIEKLFNSMDVPLWKVVLRSYKEEVLDALECKPIKNCGCPEKGALKVVLPTAQWCPYCGEKL